MSGNGVTICTGITAMATKTTRTVHRLATISLFEVEHGVAMTTAAPFLIVFIATITIIAVHLVFALYAMLIRLTKINERISGMNEYTEKQKRILLAIKAALKTTDFEDVNCPKIGKIKDFIWIGFQKGLIGNDNCHYEFIFQKESPEKLSLEVHLDENRMHKLFSNILLPDFLQFDNWNCRNGRIVFRTKRIDINDSELVQNSLALLKELHNAIGEQLLEIMQAHPELLPKQFQIPKLLENSRKVVMRKKYAERSYEEAKVFNSRHGEIQKKLKQELGANYKCIDLEKGFENYKYQIDLLAQKKNGHYDIYEIKPYPTAMACIREALGQLFFYKFLLEKGKYVVDTLYIVGPSELSNFEDEFLQSIKKDFKNSEIEIEYYPAPLN